MNNKAMLKLLFKDKRAKLYCGDCLDILPHIKDESVDLIITSPPYNNYRNKRTQKSRADYWKRTNIDYDFYADALTDEQYEEWQLEVLNHLYRVLKPSGTLAYNHKDRITDFAVWTPLSYLLKSPFILRQRVVWDRRGMQAYNPVRFYRTYEDIYIMGKGGDFVWNSQCAKYKDIWPITPSKNSGHPCSFPGELVRRLLLSFSNENSIVLDPFAGSGAVLMESLRLKRRSIAIESSPKYCQSILEAIQSFDKWNLFG